jgi:hypothetical protein
MGVTIQFESHRVELPFVYEAEHDPQVLEYYDQPGEKVTLAQHFALPDGNVKGAFSYFRISKSRSFFRANA